MTTLSLFFPSDTLDGDQTVAPTLRVLEERRLTRTAIERVHIMLRMSKAAEYALVRPPEKIFAEFFHEELFNLYSALDSLVSVSVSYDDLWFLGSVSFRAVQARKKDAEDRGPDATAPADAGSLEWTRTMGAITSPTKTSTTMREAAENALLATLIAEHPGIQERRWTTTVATCIAAKLPFAALVIAREALETVTTNHIRESLRSYIDTILRGLP